MYEVGLCIKDQQHSWLPTTGKGMQSYSCPTCGTLVYWSEASLTWIKPGTSGGKAIPGNKAKE